MSEGNRKRRRAAGLLPEPGKCAARNRRGDPCRLAPMKGAAVCHKHGGKAPQVQRKAQERIAHASDIAVLQILALMQAPDTPAPVKLAAAKDLLDRASVTGKTTIEVEVPAWQKLLDGIVATVEPGTGMRVFAETQAPVDPLVVEAERADHDASLTAHQHRPAVSEWNDRAAYGDDLPTGLPHPRPRQPDLPPPPTANGDETPPPRRLPPERERIEPDEEDRKRYVRSPSRPPRPGRGGLSRRRR